MESNQSTNQQESLHHLDHATRLDHQEPDSAATEADKDEKDPLLIEAQSLWDKYLQQQDDQGSRSLIIPSNLVHHPPAIKFLTKSLGNTESKYRPEKLSLTQSPPEKHRSSPQYRPESSSIYRLKCLLEFLRVNRSHWKSFYFENDRSRSAPHVAKILEEIAKAPCLQECRLHTIYSGFRQSLVGHRLGEIVQKETLHLLYLQDCTFDVRAEEAFVDALQRRARYQLEQQERRRLRKKAQKQQESPSPVLYHLALVDCRFSANFLHSLSLIPNPQWCSLNLSSLKCTGTRRGVESLATLLGHQTELQELTLSNNDALFRGASLRSVRQWNQAISHHEKLQALFLDGCRLPVEILEVLCESYFAHVATSELKTTVNKQHQDNESKHCIKVNDWTATKTGHLWEIAHAHSFLELQCIVDGLSTALSKKNPSAGCERILFRDCSLRGEALGTTLGGLLMKCQELTELSFIDCRWTDCAIEALTPYLQACSSLQKLVWSRSEMRDSTLQTLFQSNSRDCNESGMWRLQSLDLSGNELGADALKSFVLLLQQNQQLKSLDISGNRDLLSGSDLCRFFGVLSNQTSIRSLVLSLDGRTNVDGHNEDFSLISALLQSIESSHLHVLDISQSRGILVDESWRSQPNQIHHLQCLFLPRNVLSNSSFWPVILERLCSRPSDATAAFSFMRSHQTQLATAPLFPDLEEHR